ncbi:MAG: DNA polymerase I [Akkermansia sp.]
MATFCILDGMALIFRAFYAFINRPMRSSSGLNTSAMFGFLNTVLYITEQEKPTHIVCCLDSSGPTFRHELFPDYKATRQAAPQELRDSIPHIVDLLHALRIPVLRQPGYEADDLIGSMARLADGLADWQTLIVSKDKDLGQLLTPRVSMLRPGNKGAEFERVTQEAFLAEWGLQRPEQVIDLLALMGDASDNIPGVPGVGGVTAKKLLAQFGSLENLLSRSAELKGKLREKIENSVDTARLSYKLATIRCDVPTELRPQDCAAQPYNRAELARLLDAWEFTKLRAKLCGEAPEAAPLFASAEPPAAESPQQLDLFAAPVLRDIRETEHRYHLVSDAAGRAELAAQLEAAPRWAFDSETTGLDPLSDRLLGLSFCLRPHEAFYVPIAEPAELEPFRAAFAGSAEKVGLNLKFDLQVLRTAGMPVAGPFFDVMLAHAALFPELRHNMDSMAEALLAYRTIHLEELAGKEMRTAEVPTEQMAEYAAEDADVTLQLADVLLQQLRESRQEALLRDIEFPLVPVLADIEAEGMRVEPELLQEGSAALSRRIDALLERMNAIIGRPINLNSPRQLGELLFGEMKLLAKPKKTRTGQYVTDEETLRRLVPLSPLVGDILEYREMSKLKSTYLDALPRYISPADGRIHATLLQMVTATGRLACQNPNLQNIPVRSEEGKLIRRAFVARSGEFSILSADYSQVELRLMAALSADPALIAAFRERRDIHAETAARLYGVPREEVTPDMRRAAKTVNFGIIYGISAFGLSQRLDCPRSEAAALIESYFAQFPKVKECMERLTAEARERGYAETLCGRRRLLPDLNAANFNLRQAAERTAINTPIQGSAADMIKLAMVRVVELLRGRRSKLIMQIHDELLIDLHREERDELIPAVVQAMQQALPLPNGVPLEVEAQDAPNWLEAH